MSGLRSSENIPYHAARLIVLISECGLPRRGDIHRGIRGRTLLAKLDFFLRYPSYLARAMTILGSSDVDRAPQGTSTLSSLRSESVESQMVRYLYGPWDHAYYITIAYLVGKGLIVTSIEGGTEVFRLTTRGRDLALSLRGAPAFETLAQRAALVYRIFRDYTGSRLKQFIYREFPEVVARRVGSPI